MNCPTATSQPRKYETLTELEALSDKELRVMLAEALGWTHCRVLPLAQKNWAVSDEPEFVAIGCRPPPAGAGSCAFPDYPRSLDACREVEKTLNEDHRERFISRLCYLSSTAEYDAFKWCIIDASARQRTIALIATLTTP